MADPFEARARELVRQIGDTVSHLSLKANANPTFANAKACRDEGDKLVLGILRAVRREALEEAIELTKMNAKHEDRSARRLRKRGSDLGYQHRIARDALNANAAAIRALLAEPEKEGAS